MRCPKCGYISFDHMESCLKCKKDISGSTEVEGTTYHAAAPSFLRVPKKNDGEPETDVVEEEGDISFDGTDAFNEDDYEFSDPDLDVIVGGSEEGTITFGGSGSEDFMLEADDESDEEGSFELDLDDGDLDFSDEETVETPALSLPDELDDISDLAPPEDLDPEAISTVGINLSIDDEVNLDEDLDLDGLDLDLGLSDTKDLSDADLSLSLDDIELSAGNITAEKSDLDDINMDLDLDVFEAPPASSKEKTSESLDDIFLSLD